MQCINEGHLTKLPYLADAVTVGETYDKTILRGIVLVLILGYHALTGTIVSLALCK